MLVGPLLGYVYFVVAENLDAVKIGYSKSPWARLDNLRTASPVGLQMLWIFKGTRAVEDHLHFQFQNYRVPSVAGGKWFRLSAVLAGFHYYGQDPAALIPAVNRRLGVSGALPPGLLPLGASQQGPTEMEISAQRRAEQSRVKCEQKKAERLRIEERRVAKKSQREERKRAWHQARGNLKKIEGKISVGDDVGWLTVLALGEFLKCRCRCGLVLYKTEKALRSASGRSCNECRAPERASRKS